MSLALIVMFLIIVLLVVKTVNRFALKDPIHPSVIRGLELAIAIGAILWWLEKFGVIRFS